MKRALASAINGVRTLTPLWLRVRIGPYVGYAAYFLRVRILGNQGAPAVLSLAETVEKIRRNNLSVIRFGDGELSAIERLDLGFQKGDVELSSRLTQALQADLPGLLICIPGIFGRLEHFRDRAFWFTIHHLFRHGDAWRKLLSPTYVYGDAFITRPYLAYKDTSHSEKIFREFISIWDNKEIVLIEGSQSRLGVGNDLFARATSVERILCPAENAYAKYEDIHAEAKKIGKEKMVLLSIGPTAKILALDLYKAGYRVLDIGHIDMEYEMFLRKEPDLKAVKYKYFNEINERSPEECDDPLYTAQIIAKIE